MLKKSDLLPLALAFLSTVLIVGLGFLWLTKSTAIGTSSSENVSPDDSLNSANIESSAAESSRSPAINSDSSNQDFATPYIVPEGTSVVINGSRTMIQVNQLLRKRFHQEFPGTEISIDADGTKAGIKLLIFGEIDIAAIDRPLEEAEKSAGLAAKKIARSTSKGDVQELYYAYREPANSEVEAFLGYVLSPEAQSAITNNFSGITETTN